MDNKITRNDGSEVTTDVVLKNLMMHEVYERHIHPSNMLGNESIEDFTTKLTLKYLKAVGQYRQQFELCLKTFDGKSDKDFTPRFQQSALQLYSDYADELAGELVEFIIGHKAKSGFYTYSISNQLDAYPHFQMLLQTYLKTKEHAKTKVASVPTGVQTFKLHRFIKNGFNSIGGKCRKLGQFACIEEAIDFVNLRIGLFGSYRYKKLVDDLDELKEDFLINTNNGMINEVKANKSTDDLVEEAMNTYEVLGKPKYLIDSNLYRQSLRRKFNAALNRW